MTQTAPADDPGKSHYVELDGLRGLAILMVVVYHLALLHEGLYRQHASLLLQTAQLGWIGVDLFFVLSGFLITGILLSTKTTKNYFRNFLARRFLRIWPLYYATLVLFFVVMPLVLTPVPPELRTMYKAQAWFWMYGANWLFARQGGFNGISGGYLWSLAVEEQFYLVWPIVVYFLPARRLLRLCVLLFITSFATRVWLIHAGLSPASAYAMTITHLDGLTIGAAVAILLRSPSRAAWLRRMAPIVAVVAVAGIGVVRALDGSFFFWGVQMAQ